MALERRPIPLQLVYLLIAFIVFVGISVLAERYIG